METKTLTTEQIEQLHEFCELHDVIYYDVQIELVDHFASAIEKLWETKPQLTFEEALVDVSEQFGVDPFYFSNPNSLLPLPKGNMHSNAGFEAITETRTKALDRKYCQVQFAYFVGFFKLPKLVLTAASIILLAVLFEFAGNKVLVAGIVQVVFLFMFFLYWLLVYRKKMKLTIEADKRFLMNEHLRNWKFSPLFFAALSPGMINAISKIFEIQDRFLLFNYVNASVLTAFFITIYGIIAIVSGIYLPLRIKSDFQKAFPHFFTY